MFGSDALMLARLANCSRVHPDPAYVLSRVSARLRPLAERLLAVGPHERQDIWDEFLDDRCVEALTRQVTLEPIPPRSSAPQHMQVADSRPSTALAVRPQQEPAARQRSVKLTCAIDVKQREIEWLWAGRVPLGMITMFAGDPKLGKSFVTLAMAAALSRGLTLPNGNVPAQPGSTILMSAEDDPGRTITPRLAAVGAELSKVHILESVILANGAETLPSLRADIDAITAAATRLGDCRLIVIDPVSAYLKGVDDNHNAALRGALSPLKNLAERLAASVVLVSHLTKAGSANRKHRVLGSIAYVGACRANFLFVPDPQDPTERRVLMLDNGGNVAPPAPALAYTIEDLGQGPRVVWSDTAVPINLDQAQRMQSAPPAVPERAAERLECDDWLRTLLAEGDKAAVEIFKAGTAAGFTKDQIRRAKYRIGIVARREGFARDGRWSWRLPVHAYSDLRCVRDQGATP
jgi:hypothetical protein